MSSLELPQADSNPTLSLREAAARNFSVAPTTHIDDTARTMAALIDVAYGFGDAMREGNMPADTFWEWHYLDTVDKYGNMIESGHTIHKGWVLLKDYDLSKRSLVGGNDTDISGYQDSPRAVLKTPEEIEDYLKRHDPDDLRYHESAVAVTADSDKVIKIVRNTYEGSYLLASQEVSANDFWDTSKRPSLRPEGVVEAFERALVRRREEYLAERTRLAAQGETHRAPTYYEPLYVEAPKEVPRQPGRFLRALRGY